MDSEDSHQATPPTKEKEDSIPEENNSEINTNVEEKKDKMEVEGEEEDIPKEDEKEKKKIEGKEEEEEDKDMEEDDRKEDKDDKGKMEENEVEKDMDDDDDDDDEEEEEEEETHFKHDCTRMFRDMNDCTVVESRAEDNINLSQLLTSCVYDTDKKKYLKMPWDVDNWEITVRRFTKAQGNPPKTSGDLDKFTKTRFFKDAEIWYPKEVRAFINVFPELCKLVLNVKEIFGSKRVPLLHTKTCGKTELTRKQAACLIALSFFGDYFVGESGYNFFSVRQVLIKSTSEHILSIGVCYMNYLTNIGNWLKMGAECDDLFNEKIVYMRHSIQPFRLENRKIPLCEVKIIEKGSLSLSEANYHVDFANKLIGGGALLGGCVQEELMFALQPELACSMAFMEVMDPTDAIRIDNTLCHSCGKGYGWSFRFDKNELTSPSLARKNGKVPRIIAMDAIIQGEGMDQFSPEMMHRDIHKAFVCFKLATEFQDLDGDNKVEASIATGNWGCGAFGGDHELKFMQQWIAASLANVSLLEYYAYESPAMNNVTEEYAKIRGKYKTVKKLLEKLSKCDTPETVVKVLTKSKFDSLRTSSK